MYFLSELTTVVESFLRVEICSVNPAQSFLFITQYLKFNKGDQDTLAIIFSSPVSAVP